MSHVVAFTKEWIGLVALVLLGEILRVAVSAGYAIVKRRLDDQHPDDLPMEAGEWLMAEVEHRSLDIEVLVSPTKTADVDAFLPSAKTIVLSQETYCKNDPSFWAVAAHELGHALVYRRLGIGRVVFSAARIVGKACVSVATSLIFANILFASHDINRMAFALLSAGVAMWALVLVDEAAASAVALRILARDRRLAARGLRGARLALAAAFMTYVGALAGQALLVLERDFVAERIERQRHFVPGHSLGAGSLALAAVLSFLLAFMGLHAIARTLRPRRATTAAEAKALGARTTLGQLVRGVLALALLGIVWDQPFGDGFAVACALAILASRSTLEIVFYPVARVLRFLIGIAMIVVLVVVAIPVGLALASIRALRPARPEVPLELQPVQATEGGAAPYPFGAVPLDADVKRSEAAMERIAIRLHNEPPWYERAPRLALAGCHLVFVIAIWAGVLRG